MERGRVEWSWYICMLSHFTAFQQLMKLAYHRRKLSYRNELLSEIQFFSSSAFTTHCTCRYSQYYVSNSLWEQGMVETSKAQRLKLVKPRKIFWYKKQTYQKHSETVNEHRKLILPSKQVDTLMPMFDGNLLQTNARLLIVVILWSC